MMFGLIWAAIAIALSVPWMIKQITAFHPPVRRTEALEVVSAE
jgi:hypothetical protein